jgi:hypothetical protein
MPFCDRTLPMLSATLITQLIQDFVGYDAAIRLPPGIDVHDAFSVRDLRGSNYHE